MNWASGYTYKIYGCEVDPKSWADRDRFNVKDGSVSKEADELRQAADITVQDYQPDREVWVRLYMDVEQSGDSTHQPLFTGLATSPSYDQDGVVQTTKMECYSVLKPCDDVLLMRGWYASAYRDPVKIFKELLEPCPAPVTYDEELPTLTSHLVAEDNESKLTMLDKVLKALGLQLRIAGDGSIHIGRPNTAPVVTFSPNGFDIIEPELSVKNDWYSCPNVVMAIDDDLMAIARDNDEDSPLSIENRGREIWLADDSVDLNDGESLAEYAKRILKEEQSVVETIEYKRAFIPDVEIGDTVRLRYEKFAGLYRVESQSFDLGGNVSEEVSKL